MALFNSANRYFRPSVATFRAKKMTFLNCRDSNDISQLNSILFCSVVTWAFTTFQNYYNKNMPVTICPRFTNFSRKMIT